MSSQPSVRTLLRHLLFAQRRAFAKDAEMQAVARANIRERFDVNSRVTDAAEVARLREEAIEATRFLRENVVQNTLNERGHYVPGENGVEVR